MIEALEEALWFMDRREILDKDAKIQAAIALGGYGVFSSRMIAAILQMPHTYVAAVINKRDRTGGKFRPEALKPLLKVAQNRANGEIDVFAVKEALDAGVTKYLASRLTNVPPTSLERQYARAEILMGGEA